MSLQPGQILNSRYRIVSHLSSGGMGSVYRAWDVNLQMACAVKENLSFSQEATSQFMREAHMLAALNHPNLPRVIDYFVLPNAGQYLVMSYVEGHDLQAIIDHHGALPEQHALGYIVQVCDALTYVHSRTEPVIHRDIKPANIRITPQGVAVLVDFGIAKQVGTADGKTTQGARAVTPGFSPIEQYGYGQTTPRTDIYALGATLLALVTGKAPPESVQRYSGKTLVTPPNVSPHVGHAILRAMSLSPEERFESASAFKRALLNPAIAQQPAPVKQRSALFPGMVALLLIVLLLAAGGYWFLSNRNTADGSVETFSTPVSGSAGTSDRTRQPAPEEESAVTEDVSGVSRSGGEEGSAAVQTGAAGASLPVIEKTVTPEPTETPEPTPTPTTTPTVTPTPTVTDTTEWYSVLEFGRSAGDNPLYVHRLGTGPNHIMLVGGILGGMSPVSIDISHTLIDYFSDNPGRIPSTASLYIIPNFNPDAPYAPGETRGRLNANGVDLNRNWGCNWKAVSRATGTTTSSVSGGREAFSEPETRALRDLILETSPKAVIFYSSRANNGMVFEGWCNGQGGGSATLATLYRRSSNYPPASSVITGEGEAPDWIANQGIPSIFILTRNHTALLSGEWDRNRNAVISVIDSYGR